MPQYAQFNVGIAREFLLPNDPKPVTVRSDIINLFDTSYLIRDGSGIGVFARNMARAAVLWACRRKSDDTCIKQINATGAAVEGERHHATETAQKSRQKWRQRQRE